MPPASVQRAAVVPCPRWSSLHCRRPSPRERGAGVYGHSIEMHDASTRIVRVFAAPDMGAVSRNFSRRELQTRMGGGRHSLVYGITTVVTIHEIWTSPSYFTFAKPHLHADQPSKSFEKPIIWANPGHSTTCLEPCSGCLMSRRLAVPTPPFPPPTALAKFGKNSSDQFSWRSRRISAGRAGGASLPPSGRLDIIGHSVPHPFRSIQHRRRRPWRSRDCLPRLALDLVAVGRGRESSRYLVPERGADTRPDLHFCDRAKAIVVGRSVPIPRKPGCRTLRTSGSFHRRLSPPPRATLELDFIHRVNFQHFSVMAMRVLPIRLGCRAVRNDAHDPAPKDRGGRPGWGAMAVFSSQAQKSR